MLVYFPRNLKQYPPVKYNKLFIIPEEHSFEFEPKEFWSKVLDVIHETIDYDKPLTTDNVACLDVLRQKFNRIMGLQKQAKHIQVLLYGMIQDQMHKVCQQIHR